jgi:hypothetical protein
MSLQLCCYPSQTKPPRAGDRAAPRVLQEKPPCSHLIGAQQACAPSARAHRHQGFHHLSRPWRLAPGTGHRSRIALNPRVFTAGAATGAACPAGIACPLCSQPAAPQQPGLSWHSGRQHSTSGSPRRATPSAPPPACAMVRRPQRTAPASAVGTRSVWCNSLPCPPPRTPALLLCSRSPVCSALQVQEYESSLSRAQVRHGVQPPPPCRSGRACSALAAGATCTCL